MTRAWTLRAAPLALLIGAACQEAPTTPLELPDDAEEQLSFMMPRVDPSMFVLVGDEADSLAPAPARTIAEHEGEPGTGTDTSFDPSNPPTSAIWNARTRVGFQTGSAWADGRHDYQGNVSSIKTTVSVSLDGAVIGSQSALTVQNTFMLIDFGLAKRISALTRAFVSQECGLLARGDSEHAAWWEPVPGLDITDFGKNVVTTFAPEAARQPDCAPPPPSGGGGGGGDGGTCWVMVWYDANTGVVLHWELLYCEGIGG